ncbi:unnamed protein product [Toxocara canis]|uniref:Palmitoyltransferase n=1 Tax=Toxocara canis TaxID=6265 RepID=A0A183UQ12_TOXCA|nr:unnamed protein product [Toxocara canis]
MFTPFPSPPKEYYLSKAKAQQIADDPEQAEEILREHIKQKNIILNELNEDGTVRYCKTCMCIRPDRAHHCSECATCMLRRDHHCALINSCVHQDNMKAYFLHLFYGSLYSLWTFATDFKFTYLDVPENRGQFWQISLWPWIIYICIIPRNLLLRDKWNKACPYGNLGWKKNLCRVYL